ncbi:MAG: hypothetical protein ACI4W2_04830 [Eubacterium sp.]
MTNDESSKRETGHRHMVPPGGETPPPEAKEVYVSFSGSTKGHIYSHALGVAKRYHGWADEPPAWLIDGLTVQESAGCRIEAWCDLEPY